jgi:hypothetical protein
MNSGLRVMASGKTDVSCMRGLDGEGRSHVRLVKMSRIDYAQWALACLDLARARAAHLLKSRG